MQTYFLANIQLPKGSKIRDIKKFGTFQWEEVHQPAQTKEEMVAMMKALAKAFKKSKSKKNDTRRVRR